MKFYTVKNKEAKSSVEILLNHQELKNMVNVLTEFENKIEQFKTSNKDKSEGVTHLHLKDCGLIDDNSKADIVFYVDMNEEK